MLWIWEREEWPQMTGHLQKGTADQLLCVWESLKHKLIELPHPLHARLRNRMAGLEAAASQAIENIQVSPGVCEVAQYMMNSENYGWAQEYATKGGIDFDPGKPEAICKIMRDQTRAIHPIYGSQELKRVMQGWHMNLMGFGRNNMGVVAGKFRTHRVGVGDGMKMVYVAPPPEYIPFEMERFFRAYEKYGRSPMNCVDAAVMSAILHLYFVMVHPYGDGNGRSARFLALQGLSRMEGFGSINGPAFPLSDAIFKKCWEYYKALRNIQSFRENDGAIDVSPWLEWHTEMICDAMQYALKAVADIRKRI